MAQSAISLDFSQSLVANLLDMPDKSKYVYDLTQGYNVFDLYVANKAKPRQIVGADGVFQKAVMGSWAVTGVVSSATVLGNGNLLVTFAAANTKFRAKTLIGDGSANMNLGYCVNATPSSVELQPTIGAWNTATQFVVGRTAVEIASAVGNVNGTPPVPQYYIPEYYTNQTGVIAEQMIIDRRQIHQTWVQARGGNYWAFAQEPMMLKNFMRKKEMRSIWGQLSTINSPLEGAVNVPKGMREAVLDPNYGGVYVPLSNIPTIAQFNKFITDCALRINCDRYTLFMGVGMYEVIQNFATIQNSIQYAGNTNTFGGKEVEGFNIPTYSINGIVCTIMKAPIFNDPYYFPQPSTVPGANYNRMSYTCVAVPDIDYIGTDGQVLPTVEKCYFGPREDEYGILRGIGMDGGGPNVQSLSQSAPLLTQQPASITLEIYSDMAYDWMMYGGGWLELVV